jgi:hypothetical protein
MKKLFYLLLTLSSIFLAGCFDTTQEVTINADGSGTLVNTMDMSSMVGMMKQFGGDEASKMPNMDTTILFSTFADSIPDITAQEKELVKKGNMKLSINMKEEAFVIKMVFPFQKTSDLATIKSVIPKAMDQAMKKMVGNAEMPAGMSSQEMPKSKTFDDYFDLNITDKSMAKTLNKEKYNGAADDQYMKSLQQMSSMGASPTVNYIFNLPRAATKAEGKGVKLSADKKKVTLNLTSDDFFDTPAKFEYKIEY